MANKDFDEDVFESMLNGTFVDEEPEGVEEEEIAEDDEILDDDNDGEDQEDTDLEDDLEDEEDLDDEDDDLDDEDLEDDEDDEEEDALVEDYDSDDEDEDESEEDEDEDEDLGDLDEADEEVEGEGSEDETETKGEGDGQNPETDGVDYKAFYDAVVNTEFTVNGKKSKGFSDPKKIIQSMQMAGGFSEKMAGFKKYRPFMAPLKDRGMFEDQSKFDLAMNIIDGDKEAIKQHLQTLNIDPLELDMEKISYEAKPQVASEASIAVEDAVERAKNGGYEDKFRNVIGQEWDTESFNEFVQNPQVRSDLLDHMESGAYDRVMDKMSEMKRLDYNGSFGSLNSIAQYRAAVQQLQAENAQASYRQPDPEPVVTAPRPTPAKADKVKAEKEAIKKARQEAKYKKELKAKEAKIAQQRKRAASMSKKKPKSKPAPKFDPMKVEGEELDQLMEFLINGDR